MTHSLKTDPSTATSAIGESEVSRFLFHEAQLLDEHRYEEWYRLLSEAIEYKMPVLRTRVEEDGGNEYSQGMHFFDENWASLSWRIKILSNPGTYNWVENPRSLVRRIVGNIRIEEVEATRCKVRSNFMLYRNVGSGLDYNLLTGERFDVVARRDDGELCLESRTIHLDQTLLLSQNISFLL